MPDLSPSEKIILWWAIDGEPINSASQGSTEFENVTTGEYRAIVSAGILNLISKGLIVASAVVPETWTHIRRLSSTDVEELLVSGQAWDPSADEYLFIEATGRGREG